MLVRFLIVVALLSLTGCASVMNDSMHPLRVDTKTEEGATIADADCTVSNDFHLGQPLKSGTTMMVRRSSADLNIVCKHPAQPDAIGTAISRANAGMFGNIILGGVIGAIIDHSKGTAYSYPRWLVLVFGKTLVFDNRFDYGDGPVAGQAPKPPEPALNNPRRTLDQQQRW